MSKLFRVFMILSIVLSSFPLPLYQAWAADLQLSDEATAVAEGLKDFSARIGGLGSFEEFQDPVFFTLTGPGDENALRLDTLFWESLGNNLAASYPDLASLLTDIDGFDGDYGGVAVAFSNVTGQTDGNLTTVSFDMNAARTASLPVAYASQPVEDPDSATPGPCDDLEDNGGDGMADGEDPDCSVLVLSGGGITTTLGLTASLEFQLDSDQAVPSLAFGLVGEPVADVMVSAAGGISGFEGRFGFTDVDVTGNADLNEHIQVAFADPDGDGLITQDEWNNTENVDLVSMAFEDVPGMDDVAVSFNLDSDLIAGSADGSLTLTIPDLSNGGAQTSPEIDLGEHLARFGNVGPDEMLAGLAAYAAALDTSLFVADDPLPFLTGRYSDSFLPGDSQRRGAAEGRPVAGRSVARLSA